MSKIFRIHRERIEALGNGVFVLTPEPISPEVLTTIPNRGNTEVEKTIAAMQNPLTLQGEGLREWVELSSTNLNQREFKELCDFLGLDPASFGDLSKWLNIY